MMSAADLDQLLLSFCNRRWLKVARIAGKTLDAIEERGTKLDGTFADQIDARMAALVHGRLLEAEGNIKRWRYSEVRLPSGPEEAAKPAPEGGDGGGEIVAAGTPEDIVKAAILSGRSPQSDGRAVLEAGAGAGRGVETEEARRGGGVNPLLSIFRQFLCLKSIFLHIFRK